MFKVGDEVEVIENYYTWTVKGSTGIVTRIWGPHLFEIMFDYCPDHQNQDMVVGNSFPIRASHLASLKSNPLGRLGYKVKAISERHLMKCQ